MPGAYTHLTLVNEAAERRTIEAEPGMPREVASIRGRWLKYFELGAVSPDFPYLDLTHRAESEPWADLMHRENTDGVIRAAARLLNRNHGAGWERGVAWLLGYVAHVVADVTIHPVVNLRVGPYEQNKDQHRICEMNQDVHIFERLNLQVGLSDHLKGGVGSCTDSAGDLDPTIIELWTAALREAYPDQAGKGLLRLNAWFSGFVFAVDKIAEGNGWLGPIARHVAPSAGLVYPTLDEVRLYEPSFIRGLATPGGTKMDFGDIFDRARSNILRVWSGVARRLIDRADDLEPIVGNWNLDTGESPDGRKVFWS
jgi:hypothetical protein